MAITRVRWKRGTAAEWASANTVLRLGEPGWETDTQQGKVGDGVTPWNSLDYHIGAGGGGGGGGDVAGDTHAAASKTTPVSADEIPLVDSAASFGLKKLTITNLLALIAGATQTLTNKNLTSGSNTFPTFNQNTTGSAARLTTARTINGVSFDGTADISFRLDQVAAPTATVDLGGQILTNGQAPAADNDLATKVYVDAGLDEKLDATSLGASVEAAFPQVMMMVVYNSGWTLPAGMSTDPNVAWHFVGGSDANTPPNTSGPAVWDRTPS
jgi:hypothetical protein